MDADRIEAVVPSERIIALSEALDALDREDPEVAHLVKLRYFVGLTLDQSAEALKTSSRTAYRYWAYAKARMHQVLVDDDE